MSLIASINTIKVYTLIFVNTTGEKKNHMNK